MKHYDWVVLGEEIAGSWLLKKLSCSPEAKNILWVRTGPSLPSYRLPLSIAEHFEINTEKGWSVELAFPTHVLQWDTNKIDSYLGSYALKKDEWINADKKIKRICEHLFAHFPELGVISKGLWTYLGYSHSAPMESKIWASFLCGSMVEWSPETLSSLPNIEIHQLEPSSKIHFLNSTRNTVEFEIQGEQKMSAGKMILNMELARLKNTLDDESFSQVGLGEEIFSDLALYHLQIDFEKDAYLPFQKTCLLFSTEGIPDVEREISIVEKGQSVRLQVCERRNASLYSILERFKYALRDLSRGYPELSLKVKSYYPPLGLESCYSDAFRKEVLTTLNIEKRDLYRLAQVSTHTALPCIKNISPQVNCHLPYPYGPLHAAKKMLAEYV